MECSAARCPHVLLIPFPGMGHTLPMLDLAAHLAGGGLLVTVLVTPKNQCYLDPLLSGSPTIQPLVLSFPHQPAPPIDGKDLILSRFLSIQVAMSNLRDPLLGWVKSTASPQPSVIIADVFLGWTVDFAGELGIRHLVFQPSGVLPTYVLLSLWRDTPRRYEPDQENDRFPVHFPLPNTPILPWCQISSLYRSYIDGGGNPQLDFARDCFLANLRSSGFVYNTFYGLEQHFIEHLQREPSHPTVWAVGPLCRAGGEERGGPTSLPVGDVKSWLDRCPRGSVVYVCFGSVASLDPPQAAAVATGLERSGANFVWIVRDDCVVPEGFEEKVAGRGLVIRGWAPQVAILSHDSVGSFVTHCGWNSLMEGIAAGVTMVAWPMRADQYTNAWLLEDAGVAVRVCEGDSVPDPDVFARIVAESLHLPRSLCGRAAELKKEAMEAINEGGSSQKSLQRLIRALKEL